MGYLILFGIWLILMLNYGLSMTRTLLDGANNTNRTVFLGFVLLGMAYFYRAVHFMLYSYNGKGVIFLESLYYLIKYPC